MKPAVKKVTLGLLAAALVAFFYPTEQTVAPDWRITVVDEKGTRLSGIQVRETWQQNSLEDKAHEEVLQTDGGGSVHFPRRVRTSSLFSRALGCWGEHRSKASHASCGPHASVWAFGPGLGTMDKEDVRETTPRYLVREIAPGLKVLPDVMAEDQTTMILLHHCPPGKFGPGCRLSEDYAPAASQVLPK